jgi:hypothetical protein
MLDVVRIRKERGAIVIVPEIEELGRRFYPDMTVTEFERPEVVMAIEWAMGAAVALWFAKPFFEQMMKELGTEAGKAILGAIKKQFAEAKDKSPKLYSAHELQELQKAEKSASPAETRKLRETLGRQHAPLELIVPVTLPGGVVEEFKFVFLPSLDGEQDVDAALARLATDWEDIIKEKIERSQSSPQLLGIRSAPVDRLAVYVPVEGRWLGTMEVVMLLKAKKKI